MGSDMDVNGTALGYDARNIDCVDAGVVEEVVRIQIHLLSICWVILVGTFSRPALAFIHFMTRLACTGICTT